MGCGVINIACGSFDVTSSYGNKLDVELDKCLSSIWLLGGYQCIYEKKQVETWFS